LGTPRIISGKAKGTRLMDVPGDTTRPITDRVKEALFDILGPDIQEASMLDLFGGTGSVGIEALSRGAKFVRFVDNSHAAVGVIKKNLQSTHLANQAEVILGDAFSTLKRPPDRQFEYVYIAPPQYKSLWQRAMVDLDKNPGWLTSDAWVMVQIHPIEYEAIACEHMKEFDQRKYGSTLLVFYELCQ
jgi:16S rRNA (guanine966-N2)-methyltransferase